MIDAQLRTSLTDIVGSSHVIDDPAVVASYATDWTRRYTGDPAAVVRPASTEEASAVAKACHQHGVPMVPQGGNTGLAAGAVAPSGSVVVSTARLTRLEPVGPDGTTVAGAGVPLVDLQKHAAAAGKYFAVDLAARDSATVGGMVATDAGGIRVCAYGTTRAQLVGIEAVLANGTVISNLSGPIKSASGFDAAQLFCGSEGTLGLITAARMRLHPPPPASTLIMTGFPSIDTLVDFVAQLPSVLACEMIDQACMDLVTSHQGTQPPLPPSPYYLLFDIPDSLLDQLDDLEDAVTGDGLWRFRETIPETLSLLGVVHKMDVSVPLTSLAPLLRRFHEIAGPQRAFAYGHIMEGNLHLTYAPSPTGEELTGEYDEQVYREVASLHGSIAAEHGVGRAKAQLDAELGSAQQRLLARTLKQALDPEGLMNPGAVFVSEDREIGD